jgi:hypothetical protein
MVVAIGCGVIAARTIVVPHFGHGAVVAVVWDAVVIIIISQL